MNAEQLYKAFTDAGRSVAGSDIPNWASLPGEDREVWEEVATKARRAHDARFANAIENTMAEFGGDANDAIAKLRERYGR